MIEEDFTNEEDFISKNNLSDNNPMGIQRHMIPDGKKILYS